MKLECNNKDCKNYCYKKGCLAPYAYSIYGVIYILDRNYIDIMTHKRCPDMKLVDKIKITKVTEVTEVTIEPSTESHNINDAISSLEI